MLKHLNKIFFCFLLFSSWFSYSQTNPDIKRTYHWYFGEKAGLDFTSGNPTIDLNSQMHSFETGSVISDTSGNLLFYTNGDTVWNKNHQIMPNGTGLINCNSATQGGIIVKKPNSSTLYYIFTNDCGENAGVSGVQYSAVDMSLNGGLGDVTTKNTLLYAPSAEKLAAVYHCNKQDVWIVGQVRNSNKFCAYLISSSGVSSIPIISAIGSLNSAGGGAGQLKVSPNGSKMAAVYTAFPGGVEDLFDFDNNTGLVSNFISLPADTSEYGVSFSPDNTKLYIQAGYLANKVFQYDLSSGIPSAIIASRSIIYNMSAFYSNAIILGLELAPNGKIYGSNYNFDSLDVINNPNTLGMACNYVHNAIWLQGRRCHENFPNFVESYFDTSIMVGCTTSMSSVDFENSLSVYPNPVNTTLNIKANEKIIDAQVYNVLGVKSKPETLFSNNIYTLDMSNEPNGIYSIKLKTNYNTITKTIIINHN